MASANWHGDAERLDRVLPALGLARSRSRAAELIAGGQVRVDGSVAAKPGARVPPRSLVEVEGSDHYVSRAAHKLVAGLDSFSIDPSGALALDVGASTGGFTQVLLERGARRVLSIDVGHGQLAEQLRLEPGVTLVEGLNARELSPRVLAERTGVEQAPELIVADLSFISLELVLPAIRSVAADGADFVLLIKPQFEVGRAGIRGGIVTNPALSVAAVERVILAAASLGLECRGLRASPITGEHGNREALAHFVLGAQLSSASGEPRDPTEWNERIRAVFELGGEG